MLMLTLLLSLTSVGKNMPGFAVIGFAAFVAVVVATDNNIVGIVGIHIHIVVDNIVGNTVVDHIDIVVVVVNHPVMLLPAWTY